MEQMQEAQPVGNKPNELLRKVVVTAAAGAVALGMAGCKKEADDKPLNIVISELQEKPEPTAAQLAFARQAAVYIDLPNSICSGTLSKLDGQPVIVTAGHCVQEDGINQQADCKGVEVIFSNGQKARTTTVRSEYETGKEQDIAILGIAASAVPTGIQPATINTKGASRGDSLYTVGFAPDENGPRRPGLSGPAGKPAIFGSYVIQGGGFKITSISGYKPYADPLDPSSEWIDQTGRPGASGGGVWKDGSFIGVHQGNNEELSNVAIQQKVEGFYDVKFGDDQDTQNFLKSSLAREGSTSLEFLSGVAKKDPIAC